VADYASPAIEQSINQVVQVTKMEHINERIFEIREGVKGHLTEFLTAFGILLNDLKILILPKDERMRELISLQAIGLSPIEAVRYYLAIRMADRGIVSAPNAAAGVPFQVGGQPTAFYQISPETGLQAQPVTSLAATGAHEKSSPLPPPLPDTEPPGYSSSERSPQSE